jgi:hypothetical protein
MSQLRTEKMQKFFPYYAYCFVHLDFFLYGKENCYIVSEFFSLKVCLKFILETSEQITEVRVDHSV